MIRRSCRCICPVVAILILTLALFTGCSDSAPPNVLLLTLDTTRADYIGCYGMTDVETPAIDALAAAGTRFARNVSVSQCTNPAHASILTGLYLARHQVYDNETPLAEAARTLAEVLQDQGYATLGAVSAHHLNPGNSGFGQGFDTFLTCEETEIPADTRNEDVLPALKQLAAGPFFAWIHYFDPHGDYNPPAPWDTLYEPGHDFEPIKSRKTMETRLARTNDLIDPDDVIPLYKGEISFLDSEIARVLATLDEMGVADNTLVVLIADHGESMTEQNVYFCHAGLYNQVLHVPLIMRLPQKLPAGHVVEAMTSSVDVFPTILELLDIPDELPSISGSSLAPTLTDPHHIMHDFVFSEAVRGVSRSVCDGEYKFIKPYRAAWAIPEKRLFRMWGDYWEQDDLTGRDSARARAMEAILDGWVEAAQAEALPAVADHEVDEKTRRALKSLGY